MLPPMVTLSSLLLLFHSIICLNYGKTFNSTLGRTNSSSLSDRALSVFSVVKFPNSACSSSTSGRNGTCYTSSECTSYGGTASGSCASSFGVCCIFEKTCDGGSVSQNLTYFTSSSRSLGSACKLKICKCATDVCQLRLDFETFVLNNPVTVTTLTVAGPDAAIAAGSANSLGDCQVDQFTVTTPGAKSPPVLCGTNTGYHMYVHASDQCNELTANFGSSSAATTSAFTIKVTQVLCSSKLKAPQGCLQYFTGTTGTITTYNYQSGAGVLLVNQDYSICVRSERTYCAVCYWSTAFKMSVPGAADGNKGVDTRCGSPGINPAFTKGGGFDYIFIADGQCNSPVGGTVTTPMETNDRYCGTELRCLATAPDTTTANAAGQTVCTMNKPFKIGVHSDNYEYADATGTAPEGTLDNNRGFSISYYQKTSCLTRPT